MEEGGGGERAQSYLGTQSGTQSLSAMPKKTAQKWAVPTKEELKYSVGDEDTSMPKTELAQPSPSPKPEERPSSLSLKNLSWQHCLLHPGAT